MTSNFDNKLDYDNNIYYKPTLDEFCLGFEYEEFTATLMGPMWLKRIVNDQSQLGYFNKKYRKFRVKYIDDKDILDLNWFSSEEGTPLNKHSSLKEYFINSERAINGKMWLSLRYNGWICINNGLEIDQYHVFFDGQIKNKSELKKLMQMLKILKNHVIS